MVPFRVNQVRELVMCWVMATRFSIRSDHDVLPGSTLSSKKRSIVLRVNVK